MTTRNQPQPPFRSLFRILRISSLLPLLALSACATASVEREAKQGDLDKIKALSSKVGGLVVWTSNREGLPHIFSMKLDGSELRQLTTGERTDWYPRLSPDGTKVLFSRSHAKGFVPQSTANAPGAWDLFTVNVDGSDLKKVVAGGAWGNWVSADEIVFVRGSQVIRAKLDGGEEAVLLDAADQPALASAAFQQPQLSPDGKYLALTLAGGRRQVGVWKLKKQLWNEAGPGAQATWTPDGTGLVWIDVAGKERASIARALVEKGVPAKGAGTLLDMPGKRSREAFPRLSADGKWLVYASAINSAENDVEDYELFVWELGTTPEAAVRLTFNTGSDAWPDVFTGAATTSPKAEADAPEAPAEDAQEGAEKADKAPAEEASAAPAEAEPAAQEAASPAAQPEEDDAPPSKAKGKKGKKPAAKAKKRR
jgi:hypothetical protein